MTLLDALTEAATVEDARRPAVKHPSGWEPGCEDNGYTGHIITQPTDEPIKDYDAILRFNGLDPADIEVIEPVQSRAWDTAVGNGQVSRFYYHKINWRRKRAGLDVDVLLGEFKRHKPRKRPVTDGDAPAFVVVAGDLQLGKVDGDGAEGTVERFRDGIDRSVQRLRDLRRKKAVGDIYLGWVGDCIEGFNSQGGSLQWRVSLTLTEQVRVLRRLMLEQVEALAPLCERLTLVSVPGNHDEAVRVSDRMSTRYDDSWAVEAAVSVGDLLQANPAAYGHVSVWTPKKDELTITLDIAGTITGFAHGHQFGRDPNRWWADQAHGMQAIGDATLLFAGHKHHLKVEQSGFKTFIQTPALDGGSQWWKHKTGQESPPGTTTVVVGGGGWSDLAIL